MVKGNMGTELLAWLLFLIPGLIYSLWRMNSVYKGCPVCKAANMIPVDSPIARKFLADLQPKETTQPPSIKVVSPPEDPYYDKENDVYIIDAK